MELPSLPEYKTALRAVLSDAPDAHVAMLRAHAISPGHRITASDLARAAGYSGYGAANLQYGKFAHRICDELRLTPKNGNSGEPTYTYVLASSRKLPDLDLEWTLHDVVVDALATLDDEEPPFDRTEDVAIYPDEVSTNPKYQEGAVSLRLVNARERDPAARVACLDYWGTTCVVCEVDFAALYGVTPSRFIHVHHLQPLSSLTTPTTTDPKTDLRPVCPNCHTALHMSNPPMSIDELRSILRRRRCTG